MLRAREGNGTKGVPHEGHLIVDYSSRAEDGCAPEEKSRAELTASEVAQVRSR